MGEASGVFDNITEYCPPDMTAEAFRAWLLGDVDRSYFEDTSAHADEFKGAMPENTSLILAIQDELDEAWELVKDRVDGCGRGGLKREYILEICLLAGVDPARQFSMPAASKFLAKFVELSGISVAIGATSSSGDLAFAHKNTVPGATREMRVVFLVYSYYDAPHFMRVVNPAQRFEGKFLELCAGILGV